MSLPQSLRHERVDDIPFLLGLIKKIQLPELIDTYVPTHGAHQGLSTGTLVAGWLAAILSEATHAKSTVEDWAVRHQATLTTVLEQPIRETDFTDDRLGLVLQRLSDDAAWEALEAALWQSTATVYQLPAPEEIRLDTTTFSGFHTVEADGLMQYGQSKAHRPDLPQVKLMAAVAEPVGQLLATDLYPGQRADDGLYLPLMARVRQMLKRPGLLYCGDSKMAALATRATVVRHDDYYLVPLALGKEADTTVEAWLTAGIDGSQPLTLVMRPSGETTEAPEVLGGGYEMTRLQSALVDGVVVLWTERVLVVRSCALLDHQTTQWMHQVEKAEAALYRLTLPPKQGRKQYRDRASLETAVAALLERHEMTGLLHVTLEEDTTGKVPRWVVVAVTRDDEALQARVDRLGWRVLVTNAPLERLMLPMAVLTARDGWQIEQQFHQLHDHPLGITPLQVRRADQLVGLVRVLTLALRLLTLLTSLVRQGLRRDGLTMAGLYPGQATRTTDQPTGRRLLKAIAHGEITVTLWEDNTGQRIRHLSPLPPVLKTVLAYCQLPDTLYTRLADMAA